MSGGSYDYAFLKLEEFAENLRSRGACHCAPPELREMFRAHLRDIVKAMHAIEWNDSCDGHEDEVEFIKRCLRLNDDGTQTPHESAARVIAEHKLKAIRALIGDV